MGEHRNIWFTLSLILSSALILTTTLTVYFYTSYREAEKRYANTLSTLSAVTYPVKILIKYDNGTKIWYNQTLIPIGWSLLQATNKTTEGKVVGEKFSFGMFVTSINGVPGKGPVYWIAYSWNGSKWDLLNIGSDQFILKQGEIVAWYLTGDLNKMP